MSNKTVAKINQKVALRFALGLFTLAGLFLGIQALVNRGSDLDIGDFDSTNFISASMETKDGNVAILIGPDGVVQSAPDHKPGQSDLPPVWDSTGSRLYFVSDREDNAPHIYRWNPAGTIGSKVQRRSLDGRSKSFLSFKVPGGNTDTALMVSGGTVIEFNPAKGSSTQVLPPMGRNLGSGGGDQGGGSVFDQLYEKLGASFRIAYWGPDKEWIAAVMRREDGEILIIQSLLPGPQGQMIPPMPVMAGDKIEIDVSPTDGKVVFAVMNFQFNDPDQIPEEFIKNGKVVPPFKTFVGLLDVAAKQPPKSIMANENNKLAFSSPKFSPDGTKVLLQIGEYDSANGFKARGLATVPAEENGGKNPTPIISADDTYDISWKPNGEKVIFAKQVDGIMGLFEVPSGGGTPQRVGPADVNLEGPAYSPKVK